MLKDYRLLMKHRRGGSQCPENLVKQLLRYKLPNLTNEHNKLTILLPEIKAEGPLGRIKSEVYPRGTIVPSKCRRNQSSFKDCKRKNPNYVLYNEENEALIDFKSAAKIVNFSFKKIK